MSSALATLDVQQLLPSVPGKTAEQMMATLRRNLAGGGVQASDLTKIVVPVGSSPYFTVLGKPMDSFDAVIVGVQPGRRYYATAMKPGQATVPPDCVTTDLLTGIGNPGGSCLKCPYNAWGSARAIDGVQGRGKGCSEYRWIFARLPGDTSVFPTIVQVPVTSLKALRKFFITLGATYDPWQVMTRFNLIPGSPAPSIEFKIAGVLPTELATQIENYASQMAGMIEGLALTVMTDAEEDAVAEGEEGPIPF